MDGVVDDVHSLVGAHLQGLLDRVGCLVGSDGEDSDLTFARFDDLERLLDGILVELGEQPVDVDAIGRAVGGVEGALCLRVGHILHADDDVHLDTSSSRVLVRVWTILSGQADTPRRPGRDAHHLTVCRVTRLTRDPRDRRHGIPARAMSPRRNADETSWKSFGPNVLPRGHAIRRVCRPRAHLRRDVRGGAERGSIGVHRRPQPVDPDESCGRAWACGLPGSHLCRAGRDLRHRRRGTAVPAGHRAAVARRRHLGDGRGGADSTGAGPRAVPR
ncbi:MAG: hypothetical protein BWY91_03166 [bacterium ADurb.BinA028]|nr:MAG: hypothetical protein BWY91_03166 [bacterium ADurb.BinA028]